MELFACIAWLIWNERNNMWQGKNMLKPETIISKAILFWKNSRRQIREKRKRKKKEERVDRNVSWSPPPHGSYKLNTDGAIDSTNGRRGLGVVIRNENGELMGICASPIYECLFLTSGH